MLGIIYLPLTTEQILEHLPFLGLPRDNVVPLINKEDIKKPIILDSEICKFQFSLPTNKI